jgi:uncharacterized membrane protein
MFSRVVSLFVGCFLLLVPLFSCAQSAEPEEMYSRAKVISIDREWTWESDTPEGTDQNFQLYTVEITSGDETGKKVQIQNGARDDQRVTVGETIVITKTVVPPQFRDDMLDGVYHMSDKYRLPSVYGMFAVFFFLTILFARLRGFTSILGLLFSILILSLFVVPHILRGENPLAISVIGALLISIVSMYLAHGFRKRTTIALISTLITIAISAFIAIVFVHWAQLFGLGTEEAFYLQIGVLSTLNLRGLLLGGIIIGALGVLDDITTAQTAAVDEISKANPSLRFEELVKRGHSIGREHITSLVNTLALAYVGASLPLLLIFSAAHSEPLWVLLNREYIIEELVRTLIGSITLILGVPISTLLAALFLRADPHAQPVHSHEGHHH